MGSSPQRISPLLARCRMLPSPLDHSPTSARSALRVCVLQLCASLSPDFGRSLVNSTTALCIPSPQGTTG
jgi:hypothetical protein